LRGFFFVKKYWLLFFTIFVKKHQKTRIYRKKTLC